MDQHPPISQDRIQAESVGGGDGEEIEGAGDEHQHGQEEGGEQRQDSGGVGLEADPGCSGRGKGTDPKTVMISVQYSIDPSWPP